MSTYSLIIQGPIISVGRTGKTHVTYTGGDRSSVVQFNCVATIQQTLRQFSHLFQQVVVATWEGAPIEAADVAFCTNCTLLKLEPLEKVYKSEFHPTGEINLLKQFVSVQKGLAALNTNQQPDYIVKMRTDQWIDLALLLMEHQQASASARSNKIFIPYYVDNTIGDFYFVSTPTALATFCTAVIELLPRYKQLDIINFSVHLIMPLLYRLQLNDLNERALDPIYLKSLQQIIQVNHQTYTNCAVSESYAHFLRDHFQCFSEQLLTSTIWRGDGYQIPPQVALHFEVAWDFEQPRSPALDAFNLFLYYSPQRYFSNQGAVTFKSILGVSNWVGMQVLPFYYHWIINKNKAS